MAALTARADAIFKKQGMTKGTVAERMRALGKDPRFLYPNTDKGKADLIAKLNEQIQEMQRRLPEAFGRLPKAKCDIRRVPPEIEAGAPGGYYQIPALDGRSEEHTSELQSLMRTSYAVFCLNKKTHNTHLTIT